MYSTQVTIRRYVLVYTMQGDLGHARSMTCTAVLLLYYCMQQYYCSTTAAVLQYYCCTNNTAVSTTATSSHQTVGKTAHHTSHFTYVRMNSLGLKRVRNATHRCCCFCCSAHSATPNLTLTLPVLVLHIYVPGTWYAFTKEYDSDTALPGGFVIRVWIYAYRPHPGQ